MNWNEGMMGTSDHNDPREHESGKRFVLLRHDVGPCFDRTTESHLDWMFATGDALATWSTELITDLESTFTITCQKLADHRLIYLDREGDLGGGRGCVQRVVAGEYLQLTSALAEVAFKAALRWQTECGVRSGLLEIVQRRQGELADSEPNFELHFTFGR